MLKRNKNFLNWRSYAYLPISTRPPRVKTSEEKKNVKSTKSRYRSIKWNLKQFNKVEFETIRGLQDMCIDDLKKIAAHNDSVKTPSKTPGKRQVYLAYAGAYGHDGVIGYTNTKNPSL